MSGKNTSKRRISTAKRSRGRRRKHILRIVLVTILCVLLVGMLTLIGGSLMQGNHDNAGTNLSRKQMREAYESGVMYLAQNNLELAAEQFKKIDRRSVKYTSAQKRLLEIEEKENALIAAICDETMTQVNECIQRGNHSQILPIFQQAIAKHPDEKMMAELEKAMTEVKQNFMNQADLLVRQGYHDQALSVVNGALEAFPNDSELKRGKRNLEIIIATEQAREYQNLGKLDVAILSLRDLDVTAQENAETVTLLNDLKTKYKNELLSEAAHIYQLMGYETAAKTIQAGLQILPDDEQLLKQYVSYINEAPVDLLNLMDEFARMNCDVHTNGADNLGNKYSHYISDFRNSTDERYVSYCLNREYTYLDGKVFLRESKKNTQYVSWLKIYGDDLLLYESPKFTVQSFPVDFHIDVRGVNVLKFVIEVERNGTNGVIGVGNLQLFR